MNTAKIKSGTLCEKHANEYLNERVDNTLVHNKTSVCSCPNCNSYDCFTLRREEQCLCEPSKLPPFTVTTKSTNPSKSSVKTNKMSETESVLKESVKKEIIYDSNNNTATIKKHSKYSYNYCVPEIYNQDNKDACKIGISTERIPRSSNVTLTYSRQKFDANTAKLSAQIMNVPYKDFKESVSYNKSEIPSPRTTKLSRYDILKRIKEAYKACSCKVCECLIGKTINRNEYCKCKPCECNDCMAALKSIENRGKIKQAYLSCPCVRCDRPDQCKGVVRQGPQAYCDCDLCDCLKCSDSFNKPCNCRPCECIECRSYSVSRPKRINLVVASMREDSPRAYCQCSPCDCAECGQDYTLGSSLRREMGTGINRPINCSCDTCVNQSCESHGCNSCTCDIQKRVMRKPIEKDNRDYDIHRALVKKTVIEKRCIHKNDTIAMFAAVGNSFPNYEIKNSSCNCGDCECVICSCKNTEAPAIQKPPEYLNLKTCKCSPCECVMCNISNKDFVNRKKTCECNICDCLVCDNLSKPSTSNDNRVTINNYKLKTKIPSNACKCSPCECTECEKIMYKCTGDSCYCTNCECKMCADQTKFINEIVYPNRNYYSQLPYTYGNINDNHFKIENENVSTPECLKRSKDTTVIKSCQNIEIYNQSTSVEGLKHHEPIRKYTQTLIEDSSRIREQRRHKSYSPETYSQCKGEKIVQSYRRAHEYESSRSFISENSSIGLASRISNLQPNANFNSILEQTTYDTTIPCEKFTDSALISKHDECNNYDIVDPTQKSLNYLDDNEQNVRYSGEVAMNSKGIEKPEVDERLIKPIGKTYSGLSTYNELIEQGHEITNVKDLSLKLITSLKNANERLSGLMKPKLSFYHPKVGISKAGITLTKSTNVKKDKNRKMDGKINELIQNPYTEYDETLFDMEVDYEKVKSTLTQAKAFSVELTKVLRDYEQANKKLESKSFKEYRTDINKIQLENNSNSNIQNEMLGANINNEHSCTYEPVKKYGSHNLNVMTTKKEMSNTEDHAIAKKDYSITTLPDNECITNSEDMKNNISMTQKDIKRHFSPKHSQSNISICEPISSIDKKVELSDHSDPVADACTRRYEDKNKCRSERSQKNSKSAKKLRVPRSVTLQKKLKLKEALANLASSTGISLEQVSETRRRKYRGDVSYTDETTQDELHYAEDKRETTSTATNAVNRDESSRFEQTDMHSNTPWSILKKNYLLNSPYSQNRNTLMPPLLLEVKNTLQAISRQDDVAGRSETNNEVMVAGCGNRALLQLQTEVNKLWESSMPQSSNEAECKPGSPIGKSKFDLELKDFRIASSQTCNMSNSVERAVDCMDDAVSVVKLQRQIKELLELTSVDHPVVKKSLKVIDIGNTGGIPTNSDVITKDSYDALKVKFLSLRRVSDHTVLVKWKAPQDVSDVQGYEHKVQIMVATILPPLFKGYGEGSVYFPKAFTSELRSTMVVKSDDYCEAISI